MSIDKRITDYLDSQGVDYQIQSHEAAFTAQEVAAKAHIRGAELAKAVVLKRDDQLVLAVLPAPRPVSLDKFADVTGARTVALAHEDDFVAKFPGSESGAEPPLGELYDIVVYVDKRLAEDDEIAFNAGTHTDVIRMKYADYERITRPNVVDIAAGV